MLQNIEDFSRREGGLVSSLVSSEYSISQKNMTNQQAQFGKQNRLSVALIKNSHFNGITRLRNQRRSQDTLNNYPNLNHDYY